MSPFAAVAVEAAPAIAASRAESEAFTQDGACNLEVALTTNRQIGAAIGILMHQRKVTESQGFELLREISQRTNRKLRDVADELVLTGALPPDDGGTSP